MSNFQYDLYLASIMRLCRSMRIKHEATATAMNAHINANTRVTGLRVDLERPETWKYYLNQAGIYHESDQLIIITSLDTMEPIPFTREKLLQHRSTLREYAFGKSYYNNLVALYPHQEDLIRGILNPVDLKTAIAAPDYTILHYDTNEVEEQEYELIYNLQDWIYRSADRWTVKDYALTDNLYPFTIIGKIYSFIPAIVLNLRLEAMRTYQAHSYHIWNYLNSNGSLEKYRKELTLKQAMWLYRNIEWVRCNAGKIGTFDKLLENIMTSRNLPLGSYDVFHDTSTIEHTFKPTGKALRTDLNLLTTNASNTAVRTLEYLFEKQIPVAPQNSLVQPEDEVSARQAFSVAPLSSYPTKVYESDLIDTENAEPYKLDQVLLNHWIELSATGKYKSIINVRNPYTNDLITMSVKDAFLVWLYAINKRNGVTLTTIPTIKARCVSRQPLPRYADLRPLARKDLVPDAWIDQLLDDLFAINQVISTESFNELCNTLHRQMLLHREHWVRQEERLVRGELESLINHIYVTKAHNFYSAGSTYQQFFTSKGWELDNLIPSDYDILIVDLWNLALGIDVSQKVVLKDIQRSMLGIMKQLGTYDTQYIQTINETAAMILDPIAIRIDKPGIHETHMIVNGEMSVDQIKLKLNSKLGIDLMYDTVIDPTMVRVKDKVHIPWEIPNIYQTSAKQTVNISFALPRLRFEWPNKGNLDDFEFGGDLGNIIIKPINSKDLEKIIEVPELDGLHKED